MQTMFPEGFPLFSGFITLKSLKLLIYQPKYKSVRGLMGLQKLVTKKVPTVFLEGRLEARKLVKVGLCELFILRHHNWVTCRETHVAMLRW